MGMQGDFYQLLKEQGYTLRVPTGGDWSGTDECHHDSGLQVS